MVQRSATLGARHAMVLLDEHVLDEMELLLRGLRRDTARLVPCLK